MHSNIAGDNLSSHKHSVKRVLLFVTNKVYLNQEKYEQNIA